MLRFGSRECHNGGQQQISWTYLNWFGFYSGFYTQLIQKKEDPIADSIENRQISKSHKTRTSTNFGAMFAAFS